MLLNMTDYNLEIMYKVMMKRIMKGCSARHLSFLIGRPLDYVETIESLNAPIYNEAELSVIALALEDEDCSSYLPSVRCDDVFRVSIEKNKIGNRYYYYCGTFTSVERNFTRFILYENIDVNPNLGEGPMGKYNIDIVQDAIFFIADERFFTVPRLPLEIYHKLNSFLGYKIDLYTLQLLLGWFTGDGYMFKKGLDEQQRYTFQEILIEPNN